jgi:hypothetical protein
MIIDFLVLSRNDAPHGKRCIRTVDVNPWIDVIKLSRRYYLLCIQRQILFDMSLNVWENDSRLILDVKCRWKCLLTGVRCFLCDQNRSRNYWEICKKPTWSVWLFSDIYMWARHSKSHACSHPILFADCTNLYNAMSLKYFLTFSLLFY